MRIFRLEHSDGTGPYITSDRTGEIRKFGWDLGAAHGGFEHPSPYADGILDFNDADVCGLRTKQDVKRWFKGFGKELRRHGFTVVEFEVHPEYVKHGKRQVVFAREKAVIVNTYDPTHII